MARFYGIIQKEGRLMSIFKFLKFEPAAHPSAETETVRRIAGALDRLDLERAKFIASFAYILSRVARADLSISQEEIAAMERIVMEFGELPEEQAALVVQMAKTQNILFGSTENYLVTREFNRIATHEQKLALLHCLFAVSAADENVSILEDNEVSQIADELRIEHDEFIDVRVRFRDYLAVLKNKPPAGS
jgi:uncharacterized tellurite resistance protein B-like protein